MKADPLENPIARRNRSIREALDVLGDIPILRPTVAVITGTGLSRLVPESDHRVSIPYGEIPHFPLSTVATHAGRLVCAVVQEVPVLVLEGRFHLYEGYTSQEVTFPIRVMQAIGIRHLIVSNAAGGIDPSLRPGDLLFLKDHINLTGENPLIGPHDPAWGDRFPDMSEAYAVDLRRLARTCVEARGMAYREGVYVGLKGPSLETPAEIRFLRAIGADAVGFSTVQEVIAANQCGIRVLGVSVITNVHDPDHPKRHTLEEIIEVADRASRTLRSIVLELIPDIAAGPRG
ncbi:MAG: purine-nucleoside phosphorylase [Thermodesulfobacteriota bacterium]